MATKPTTPSRPRRIAVKISPGHARHIAELRRLIHEHESLTRRDRMAEFKRVVDIGKRLRSMQFGLQWGLWLKVVVEELNWRPRTAQAYIQVATHAQPIAHLMAQYTHLSVWQALSHYFRQKERVLLPTPRERRFGSTLQIQDFFAMLDSWLNNEEVLTDPHAQVFMVRALEDRLNHLRSFWPVVQERIAKMPPYERPRLLPQPPSDGRARREPEGVEALAG